MRGTLLGVIMCAQTTFVIRNIISCKIMYGINGISHKIRNSNVKKNTQFASSSSGVEEEAELGYMGLMD